MSSYGSVVFWRYELCERSAFSLMNAFHCEPQLGARPNVFMPAARDRPPVGIDPQVAAADEVEARMIEVVVGPVVDGDALRRQAVPGVQVEREQRRAPPPPWWWLK